MKNKFRNEHRMLEDFGDEFLVLCPNCAMKSKVISLGDASPYEPNIVKRFICVSCGTNKDYVPKKNHSNQLMISYSVEWKEGFINIGGAFDWYFGYPLYLQIPCCGHTLWAYNIKHLNYLKQYVQAELRENKPYYLSIESRLPVWIKSSKNRTTILKAISKLEQKEMQN